MSEFAVLGQRVPRVDAQDKVTGKAVYAADIVLPNMLHGKILRSPYAHARIKSIDFEKAKALDGVKAIVTAADAAGLKKHDWELNPMMTMLAREKVLYSGQPVAAVAAIDVNIAEEAVRLIEVEYEVLTPVTDAVEAMKPDAVIIHPDFVPNGMPGQEKPSNVFFHVINNRGDIEAGFREAEVIQENSFRVENIHQGYLEPRSAIADCDARGKIKVWADNQGTFVAREQVAEFLEAPLNSVKVIPVEIGGAFGGKEPQILSPLCALLSLKTGRPVKIVATREEVFKDSRYSPAANITIKIGAKRDGTVTAVQATLIFDYGCRYGVHGLPEVPFASMTGPNPYRYPNLRIECFSVFTNKSPAGPYRSPTAPQSAYAFESAMDLMARELGMDPIDFRLKNAVAEGDINLMGNIPYARIGFKEVLQRMKEYLSQKGPHTGENRGRGIGCGFWAPGTGPSAAMVSVNMDGSINVTVGAVDISGAHTSLAQIAAEAMQLPFDKVAIAVGNTETAPFSNPSVGSMITRSAGTAICRACDDVKAQLCQRAAAKLKVEVSEVEYAAGKLTAKSKPGEVVTIEQLGNESINTWVQTPIFGRGGTGAQEAAPAFTCHSADIEVDPQTGKVKVLSWAIAQDLGHAVNPMLVEGQMQGAVAQGIGWALSEAYVFDKDGNLLNPNFLDYRMPTAVDVPNIDTLIVEVPSTTPPFNIRGAGEPPLVGCLGTLANAVHSATGIRLKKLPMNPEAVFNGIKSRSAEQNSENAITGSVEPGPETEVENLPPAGETS